MFDTNSRVSHGTTSVEAWLRAAAQRIDLGLGKHLEMNIQATTGGLLLNMPSL